MRLFGKCTLAAWLIVGFLLPACALNVRYGSFFTVKGITVKQGHLIMPLARKKYVNARILEEETYRWLLACSTQECSQPDAVGKTEVYSLRAAKTKPGMWIAQIAVDGRWLLTFLIFENAADVGVVVPEEIRISDDSWHKQIKKQVADEIIRLKKEGKDEM